MCVCVCVCVCDLRCNGLAQAKCDLQSRDICSETGVGDSCMFAGGCHADSCPQRPFLIKCDFKCRDICCKNGGDAFGGCPADSCPKGVFQAKCDSVCRRFSCKGPIKAKGDRKPRGFCSKNDVGDAWLLAGGCRARSCLQGLFMIKCGPECRDISCNIGGDAYVTAGGCRANYRPKRLFQAKFDSECRGSGRKGLVQAKCDLMHRDSFRENGVGDPCMLAGGCRADSCPQRLFIKCDFKCRDSCKNGGDALGGCPADSGRKGLFQAKCESECRRIYCKGRAKAEYDLKPRDICSKVVVGDACMLAGSCRVDSRPWRSS